MKRPAALKSLKKRGIEVMISAVDFTPAQRAHSRRSWSGTYPDGTLLDAYGRFYGVDVEPYIPTPKKARRRRRSAWHELIDAAMYAFATIRMTVVPEGHPLSADGVRDESWDAESKRLIAHYRRYGGRELVGKSAVMRTLQKRIDRIAAFPDARVLILGESGTGKETVALQIHNKSERRNEAFYAFNCASVTPDLLESRFFGHERGAFTGADKQSSDSSNWRTAAALP